jgi:hypothetical protein
MKNGTVILRLLLIVIGIEGGLGPMLAPGWTGRPLTNRMRTDYSVIV